VPVPQAELHVHLEGTAPPTLIRRLAARNGVPVPDGLFTDDERFVWTDFLSFLAAYDRAASVIRTREDYRDVTFEYLATCAREGAVYVELTASPDHAAAVGLSAAECFAGVARGIDDAREAFGIEARTLAACIRDLGPGRAEEIVEGIVAQRPRHVVGINLAGDEAGFPPAPFAPAFERAAEAGLGCTVHAGEHAGPESVRAALALPVTRIAHGVRAVEDPALVDELAERRIVLDTCPTSNVVLGVFESYAAHPFGALRAAGVRLTLGSDDPPYFGASLSGEYRVARERFGLGDAELREVTRTAIVGSFAAPDLKAALHDRLTV
jgi:adenosine deaminase